MDLNIWRCTYMWRLKSYYFGSKIEVDSSLFVQIFKVGNGTNYSVKEITGKISLANIEKIVSIFGWQPNVNLLAWIVEQK